MPNKPKDRLFLFILKCHPENCIVPHKPKGDIHPSICKAGCKSQDDSEQGYFSLLIVSTKSMAIFLSLASAITRTIGSVPEALI